jgi:autoinducer 2-degrading protein
MKRKGSVAAAVLLLFVVVMLPATPAQKRVNKPTDTQKTQSNDSTNSKNRQANNMIVSAVQFTFAAKDADNAVTLLREIRDASRKEPGVVRFDVARSNVDPNVFVLWEVYRDQEAVDAHSASEHFKRLVINGIRPLAQQRASVTATPLDE